MQFRAKLPWIRIVSKMQCVNSTHNFLSIVYVGILLERKRKKPKISMSIVTGTHIRHRSILFKQIVRGLRRWSRIKRGFWHRLQFIWSSIMNSRRIFAGHENIHKHTHWKDDELTITIENMEKHYFFSCSFFKLVSSTTVWYVFPWHFVVIINAFPTAIRNQK